jgi:phage shock protein E
VRQKGWLLWWRTKATTPGSQLLSFHRKDEPWCSIFTLRLFSRRFLPMAGGPMPDYTAIRRLAERARQSIREVSPAEVRAMTARGALLIDVRDDEELLRNPPLAGAVHMSRGRLEFLITDAVDGFDEPLVLYCAGGNRGALATASLRELGYANAVNLRGGLYAWREQAGQQWVFSGAEAAKRHRALLD